MTRPTTTLHELFRYDDWTRSKRTVAASILPSVDLGRAAPGPTSFRTTLHHLRPADHICLDRCRDKPDVRLVEREPQARVANLGVSFRSTRAACKAFLDGFGDADVEHALHPCAACRSTSKRAVDRHQDPVMVHR
jgi:hypothetical protein